MANGATNVGAARLGVGNFRFWLGRCVDGRMVGKRASFAALNLDVRVVEAFDSTVAEVGAVAVAGFARFGAIKSMARAVLRW